MLGVTGPDGRTARTWTPRLETGAATKHQAIYEALVADIASGRLLPGDRLPPQRSVAAALGVDLTTVTKAYGRARREGVIDATTGRGSFVARPAVPGHDLYQGPTTLLDLSKNSPPPLPGIDLRRLLAKEIGQGVADIPDSHLFNYQDTGGNWANRTAGAGWLGRWVDGVTAERVVLCSGAQSALFAVCHLLCREARSVAVGAWSYPGIHTVAYQQGLQLVPLAVDRDGIVPDAFEQICRERPPAALYVTPTIDNPTTASLPEDRRRRIGDIARRYAVGIIEDEPYCGLLPDAVPAIASHAPDITWHISTLSKCITPALRVGYVAAPSVRNAIQLAATLQAMTMMASPMLATLASRWIQSGLAAEIASAIREENQSRQRLAARILAGEMVAAHPCGPHLWLSLPPPWRAGDFVHLIERQGVRLLPGSSFAPVPQRGEAVRITLGAAPDPTTLERALSLIGNTLTRFSGAAIPAVV